METTFFRSFPKKFEFVSLCSFICLQAVYQLSGPVCKARSSCTGGFSMGESPLHISLHGLEEACWSDQSF